ncbi:MAG: hypothetical protein AAGD35_14030 [Actinomycetota bacterium]
MTTTTSSTQAFPIGVGTLFKKGIEGYIANVVPLSVAGVATLLTYGAFRYPAQLLFDDGAVGRSLLVDLVGLLIAGTIAYPWYSYALDAAAGDGVDWRRPFEEPRRFAYQATASFWFWAGVLAGVRWGAYLFFLPAILVILLYAFHGYVNADRSRDGGLKLLGVSVKLGAGYRIALFALMALFIMFNFMGAIALGFGEIGPLTITGAVVGMVITTNVTMVSGAHLYRVLLERMDA